MASPRSAQRAVDLESAARRRPPRNHRLSYVFFFLICILFLVGIVCLAFVLFSLLDFSLPLFYVRSLPIAVEDSTSMSVVPVTMNIVNPNRLDFHLTQGVYHIYYSDRDFGSGTMSSIDLGSRSSRNVTVPGFIYGDNASVHGKLLEERDHGEMFDVEMKFEGRLVLWSLKTDVNFYVSCDVRVDKLRNNSKVTYSQCNSY